MLLHSVLPSRREFLVLCRSLHVFASNADSKAQEAQKTAGNPYAPTSSAGGTPTDNKADESERYCLICAHRDCWFLRVTHTDHASSSV